MAKTRYLSSSCDENKRVYLLVSQQINCTSLLQAIICIACAVLFVDLLAFLANKLSINISVFVACRIEKLAKASETRTG